MTAVQDVNWYKYIGAVGTVLDNTTKTAYIGALLAVTIEAIPGVYHLNVSGMDCRLVGTDDVTVSANAPTATTIGLAASLNTAKV